MIFKIKAFQLRLFHLNIFVKIVKIVEMNGDLLRNLDIIKNFLVQNLQKVLMDWKILTRKCKNPLTSQLKSRQTVKKCRNFQVSMNFSISFQIVWSGHLMLRQNQEISILVKISWLSRQTFWKCQDFLDCRDKLRPPSLEKMVKFSYEVLIGDM